MSELRKLALANPPMYLDDRSPDGHILVCRGGGSEHSFLSRRLGLSVECPVCGQIALSVDLVADFYRRSVADPAWTDDALSSFAQRQRQGERREDHAGEMSQMREHRISDASRVRDRDRG
jgi:hypothetical protein